MAFHLTSKEVRHSEKNLPQVEFSNDLLEDTVAQFTAIGSSKSDRLRKLSGNKKMKHFTSYTLSLFYKQQFISNKMRFSKTGQIKGRSL